jgi:hypothetical protein
VRATADCGGGARQRGARRVTLSDAAETRHAGGGWQVAGDLLPGRLVTKTAGSQDGKPTRR